MASQPALDAWYGARNWALEHLPGGCGGVSEGWISRQDYEEKGGAYLSEHCASNVLIPMKIASQVPARPADPATLPTSVASTPLTTVTSALIPSPTTVTADAALVTS